MGKLDQKKIYKKVQLITINTVGEITFSDTNLFSWNLGESIYDAHPFFEIIRGLIDVSISSENEYNFPCVHLNELNVDEKICDITISIEQTETTIIIFDYTLAYLELNKISQQRNESLIRSQELEFSNKLLIEKETFKNDFLANINHELATPLTSIKGFLELLEKTELTYEQTELTRIIKSEGEHLQTIFNDMLDISRIEAGAFKLNLETFDIISLFETIIESYKVISKEKELDFKYSIDKKISRKLIGDKTRIYQIINNLLNNSLKYTELGFIELSIQKKGGKNRKQLLEIKISDSGIGIDEQEKATIFEPFSQVDNTSIGSGLGLNIVQNLVSLMGGTVELVSEKGKGTTFTINIGLKSVTDKGEEKEKATYVLPENKKFRILVVENKLNTQYLIIKLLLQQKGRFFVDAVSSGESALKAIENRNYDLIILDIKLLKMSGFDLTQKIRNNYADNSIKNIPILGVSALRASNIVNKAIGSGMDAFLSKPFSEAILIQKITRLLALKYK